MSQAKPLPKPFKGIALFTPAGDLIYCIDATKQERWHLQLCAGLQEILQLPEPPHFLVPCYTATVDCCLNPRTQQVQVFAEAYPLVLRHQALLNAVFDLEDLNWQEAPWLEGACDPIALASYRASFPQLWEDHDLILQMQRSPTRSYDTLMPDLGEPDRVGIPVEFNSPPLIREVQPAKLAFVLRLFVAGYSIHTERVLQTLHQLLEQSFHYPYTLTVVDAIEHPEQAEADLVSATPTLVKVWPPPIRRLVGDLDNTAKILQLLRSPTEGRGENYELLSDEL